MNKPITSAQLDRIARALFRGITDKVGRMFRREYRAGLADGVRLASLHYGYGEKMTKRIIELLDIDPDFERACDKAIKEIAP